MHIMFGVAECYPFIKTGGLADFAGAFTQSLEALGHKVSVVLPSYSAIDKRKFGFRKTRIKLAVPIGEKTVEAGVYRLRCTDKLSYYLIDNKDYYGREYVFGKGAHGYKDNIERFLLLSKSILELALVEKDVDVIHMNDWHTAIGLFYLKEFYQKIGRLMNVRSVLTIHNMAHQGMFWHYDMPLLNVGWNYFNAEQLEFHDHINFMKSGILHADVITTVSPTYSNEIQSEEFGCGLEGVLVKRREDIFGILNGVDYKIWHPWRDKNIKVRFSKNSFSYKKINKKDLLSKVGLKYNDSKPLLTMVSRLDEQKGFDLILPVFDMIMELGVQVIILGSGHEKYSQFLKDKEQQYSQDMKAIIGYDEKLAHQIYAGGDLYLMPSKFEPCGLSQLYAMKYGNIPVVRAVGGLKDTVIDLKMGSDMATGFSFEYYSPYNLYETVKQAVELYRNDREMFECVARNGMDTNFTWKSTASEYMTLYKQDS